MVGIPLGRDYEGVGTKRPWMGEVKGCFLYWKGLGLGQEEKQKDWVSVLFL